MTREPAAPGIRVAAGELKPRKGFDRHGIRINGANIAQCEIGAALIEHGADARGQAREMEVLDRAFNGEGDRSPGGPRHNQ